MTEQSPLSREELVEKVARIDYWGGRDLGPARATARRIVDMLEREGIISPPEFDQMLDPEPCDMCGHENHPDAECAEQVGYDHLNGDHECGCSGSLATRLAQAWDEGHGTSNGGCVYWPDCAEIGDHVNPYREVVVPPGQESTHG